MGAFKNLKKSDVYIVPYIANKQWNFTGSRNELTGSSIYFYRGVNLSSSFDPNGSTDFAFRYNKQYERLIYSQIKQLYYSNFVSGSSTPTSYETSSRDFSIEELGYFDNTNQSTLKTYKPFNTGTFAIPVIPGAPVNLSVLSIPQEYFGSKIVPTTFQLSGSGGPKGFPYTYNITDDGEGNLYDRISGAFVGNILYAHGLAIINSSPIRDVANSEEPVNIRLLSFKGEHIVYENEIRCLIREDEFNFTQNPSSTNYTGSYLDNITGSNFSPYVTTVGLYNDAKELLAVGKFAKPIPMSPNTDMTFVIRYDT